MSIGIHYYKCPMNHQLHHVKIILISIPLPLLPRTPPWSTLAIQILTKSVQHPLFIPALWDASKVRTQENLRSNFQNNASSQLLDATLPLFWVGAKQLQIPQEQLEHWGKCRDRFLANGYTHVRLDAAISQSIAYPPSEWDVYMWKSPEQVCVEAMASTPPSIILSPIALALRYSACCALVNRLFILWSQQIWRVLYHGGFLTPHLKETAWEQKYSSTTFSSSSLEYYSLQDSR